ncbi:MAG TPA: glycosyltransferase family 2 protein [Acidimicrobiales bacterium]|nr:glycosyltransferase family 2 protein [Acidimicrobiales bacterium]
MDPLTAVLTGLALLGALPLAVGVYQFALVGAHRFRNHYREVGDALPRTAVLIPAWNEGAVLATTVRHLLDLDYPAERLRVYVVDDASTDGTPALLAELAGRHPGRVVHLRRDHGGEGKAATLNHGLRRLLADDWMEATLVMDADVVYEPDALRKMTRHLADPRVGAVTAYIKEGSRPGTSINRFVAYEYVHAQAAARRAQDVLGTVACLAGGAQLHARANLEALGGRLVTDTLAEDTVTTFITQMGGRRVVFEPDAVAWAEEPATVDALWRQRLRWARGNLDVTRRFRHVWFRPGQGHGLGGVSFGLFWFATLLLPVFMVVSSAALVALWVRDFEESQEVFRRLWIVTALAWVFITAFALLLDPATARRTWRQALAFPGVMSLAFIVAACAPRPAVAVRDGLTDLVGIDLTSGHVRAVMLVAYVWVAGCLLVGWLARAVDRRGAGRLARVIVYVGGFGPLLCSITVDAYLKEARHAQQRWEKTEKSGAVAIRS